MEPRQEQQVIRFWSVTESNRLVGHIYNRGGEKDGELMITSPVVEVTFQGEQRFPVAITASGTAYCLGEPAEGYGQDRAEAFVMEMSRGDASTENRRPDGTMRTSVIRLR